MAIFSKSEQYVLGLFKVGDKFSYNGKVYTVLNSGKPTCSSGEPKTDIYCFAKSDVDSIELKISFKQSNADFLENKTNKERAEQIFGSNWKSIIINAITSIKNKFESRPILFLQKSGKTEEGCFTLGWKFELLNKLSGELSDVVPLTREQKIDVYSGTTLVGDKKDAIVNRVQVLNSGVATHILFGDVKNIKTIQDVINSLISVEDYVDKHSSDIYFACKALNYRSKYKKNGVVGKYDGNRPLSVYVKWQAVNGKLRGTLVFDEPLEHGGDYAYSLLSGALSTLNIKTTDDIKKEILDGINYL
jgi:hypothetical protein